MFTPKHNTIIELIKHYLQKIISDDAIINEFGIDAHKLNVSVDLNKNIHFGDYGSNIALMMNLPKDVTLKVTHKMVEALSKYKCFSNVKVTPPGFINFTIDHTFNTQIIFDINKQSENYGQFSKTKLLYNIEFVSANPTGLLHIGHARNAAIGDSLARIWQAYGINVNREYYINDAGNQIEKLAMSVLIRYKQLFKEKIALPEDAYHGNEIIDIAKLLKKKYRRQFLLLGHDGEKFIPFKYTEHNITKYKEDGVIIKTFAKNYLLDTIKKTLENFDVHMDIWFSESLLYQKNLIDVALDSVRKYTYEKEGALWLKTTEFKDDKDRVLIKNDGNYTYFLPDIAYHNVKFLRGYDQLFNIWGSDHKSYADRIKIAMQMVGFNPNHLHILIMQMVRLIKDGKEFKMSKRSGVSLTLQDLLDTIGKDAARWYLVSQNMANHLEIDVHKATSKNNDNPLYYVQYAHARINQVLAKTTYDLPKDFNLLTAPQEITLINLLHYFKHTIITIAENYEVQKMTLYLSNLAKAFHAYYAQNKIIDHKNKVLSAQRYYLAKSVKITLKNGLQLLGIVTIDKM